jgi:hypothetical protein
MACYRDRFTFLPLLTDSDNFDLTADFQALLANITDFP